MAEVIGDLLGPAVGVALSPLPIVGVILMLLSAKAKVNGPAFAAGWVGGMAIVLIVVGLIADPAGVEDDNGEISTTKAVVFLALGAVLLLLAAKTWRERPNGDEEPAMPKWMAGVTSASPLMALGLGAFLSSLNPKNLLLDISAGTTIAAATELSTAEQIVAGLVFIAVASVSVAGLVIWYLVAGDSAKATLDSLRGWMVRHNAAITTAILLILGANLIGKSLPGLF